MSEESPTATITIRTSSKILTELANLAESIDRPRNWVIEAALRSYLDAQAWQVEGIKEALASVERGEWFAHETVISDLDELLDPCEE